MHVTINGTDEILDEGVTVAEHLDRLGLREAPCAVEINKRLISRRDHATTAIREGDTIEIVTLIGGG